MQKLHKNATHVQEDSDQHDEVRWVILAVFSLILDIAVDSKTEDSCKKKKEENVEA